MKYAKEVIGLLAANPDIEFRMAQIVRHVTRAKQLSPSRRNAVREGVRRVLVQLRETGQVVYESEGDKSGAYIWRGSLPHEVVENCHARCHNTSEHNCAYRI